MPETLQPSDEVTEGQFVEAEQKMEASGVDADTPEHTKRLQEMWDDPKNKQQGQSSETWQTREQDH